MKILLLHSDDTFLLHKARPHWDLIVDFARAPASAYESWSRQAGCPTVSLSQFAEEIADLGQIRQLLQLGMGFIVDRCGIDWWDVLSMEIVPQLQQLMLVHRLSKKLSEGCELYASRPHPFATTLQRLLDSRLTILESGFQSIIQRARHYQDAFSQLDTPHLVQVLKDRFDGEHRIRRHFTRRVHTSERPVILLPSAYVNVSRTALSYAQQSPDREFLLVHSRSNAKISSLPRNTRSASLTPYFVPSDQRETAFLLESWINLRKHLIQGADEFKVANEVGVLESFPALLAWGIALRDAWNQVFDFENVTACLCADDSNPPSRIPLIMARQRGLPSFACHHGALDYMMAIKRNHADTYLVKSKMERDYLTRVCRLAPERMGHAAPAPKSSRLPGGARGSAPWLVFFTEPYQTYSWRRDEVYRDLLPHLCSLVQNCGLKLVFKLHPFESIKGHRRMLRRLLPKQERGIEVLAGPPSDYLWNNTRVALTVQSSTALECAALGIPIFLCGWLRDVFSGYVQQYARFGIGHVLESAEQMATIPQLLATQNERPSAPQSIRAGIGLEEFAHLMPGSHALAANNNA